MYFAWLAGVSTFTDQEAGCCERRSIQFRQPVFWTDHVLRCDRGGQSAVGLAARFTVVLMGEMLGLSGKEKIKINSDVNRAKTPVFIALLTLYTFDN
jgi:hypothetical protein